MWKLIGIGVLIVMVRESGSAATAFDDPSPHFEVASVRQSPAGTPFQNIGGPNTASPGRWRCSNVIMEYLIRKAWNINRFQVAPSSALTWDAYDIDAVLPSDTSPEVFRLMLQNLLKSRFGLVVRFEKRPLLTYELTVTPVGPVLKEAEPARESSANVGPLPGERSGPEKPLYEIGKDGRSQLVPGRPMMVMSGLGGVNRVQARMQSMSDLSRFLESRLGSPVKDKTGLTGLYDFVLEFARDDAAAQMIPGTGEMMQARTPAPDLFTAVRKQLGLRLESAKEPTDVLVVDRYNRIPTGN